MRYKVYYDGRFAVAYISDEQKEFIKSYCPKDRLVTSAEETKRIDDVFFLSKTDKSSLTPLRNAVMTYSKEYRESLDCEAEYRAFQGALSITAVIDFYLYS